MKWKMIHEKFNADILFILEAPYIKMPRWSIFEVATENLVSTSPAATPSDPNLTLFTLTNPSIPLCPSGFVLDGFGNCVA